MYKIAFQYHSLGVPPKRPVGKESFSKDMVLADLPTGLPRGRAIRCKALPKPRALSATIPHAPQFMCTAICQILKNHVEHFSIAR